jgi:hypothetical protein
MGESKSPILKNGPVVGSCVRVLNIHVVNTALGNLEVKVDIISGQQSMFGVSAVIVFMC